MPADFPLSLFGDQLSGASGILELMDDLGRAMAGGDMCMMGGGNPALIPEVQAIWRERLVALAAQPEGDTMLGVYDPPQGNPRFLETLADFLNRHFQWGITPANIAVTNGGQTALFILFNLLAGKSANGRKRRILCPLMPEYIGYANQGLDADMFLGVPPLVEETPDGFFKYHIDFEKLEITPDIGAICVSRPTNPTGNVLTDEEMDRLNALAEAHGIPLIIDNAYGAPFPNIVFTEARPLFTEQTILTMSLSKLGLPGTRTAFVVGPPKIIQALTGVNAVMSLANNNVGQCLIRPLLEDDRILGLSNGIIQNFYRRRSQQAISWVQSAFADRAPVRIHRSEGALFLWLRFPGLPITAAALYECLKARKVLVVPGHYFFFGLSEPHPHAAECLRVTFSQSESMVEEGLNVLADEVVRVFETAAHT